MSWKEYLETELLSKGICEAAILSPDGQVWAKSGGFPGTATDLKLFTSKFDDSSYWSENGIKMGGTKYIYLSGDHGAMRARKEKLALHAMKLKKTVIIALYDVLKCPPPEAAVTVESFGAYLSNQGF